MKTQISRDANDPDKRYSGVYQQQGRMLTDADWNALADIVKERLEEALADVIGSGAPRGEGLRVEIASPPPGFHFRGSRLYADGVPAQVAPAGPQPFAYANQADFPSPPDLPKSTAFTFYADVWERTVDALEDTGTWVTDHLVDPALHGADTTTRTQTMAQVKWCPSSSSPEDPSVNPALGDSLLSVSLRQNLSGSDPCDPCADTVAVARSIGNYLFRVEVHDVQGPPSAPTEVTLKWSSENGAEHHRLSTTSPEVNVPADFKTGDFVYELYDDKAEKHLGVHLATPFAPTRGQLSAAYPVNPPAGFRIRRWDGFAVLRQSGGVWSLASVRRIAQRAERILSPPASPGANGVYPADLPGRDREVGFQTSAEGANPGDFHFADGELVFHLRSLKLALQPNRFVAGDYWLAPVRESVHKTVDVLTHAAPTGIVHHYLVLAEFDAGGILKAPETDRDQRLNFPSLTDLRARDVDYLPACRGANQLFETKVAGQPVDTVKKALDRLCEIGAQHIAFAKPCDTSLYQGVDPQKLKTVADALKLLCDMRAGQIGYAPPNSCALFNGLKSVEQALNRLCSIGAADIAFAKPCDTSLYQGVDPQKLKTVADALKLLCDMRAGQIGYAPPNSCALFNGLKSVEQALNRLCSIGAADIAFAKPCDTSLYQGVDPQKLKTVADALKLLCDIQAQQIKFEPPAGCKILENSKTVQEALSRICSIKAENVAYTGCPQLNLPIATVKDALDALCARPSGGGGVSCRATVGKGGTFETLADAVKSIDPRDKVVALCLCLLPGAHTVEVPLTVAPQSDGQAINLTICGCGRGSQLTLKGSLLCQGLRSLRIENLLLQIEPQAQLIAQNGFEVALEGLIVKGSGSRRLGTPPPLDLQANLSVRVAECRFEFLSTSGLDPVNIMFTPLNPDLGGLFSSQLDDKAFDERQGAVAGTLVALPKTPRAVLVRGLTAAIDQPPVPLADTLRDSLRNLVTAITPATPQLPAIVASLVDVRTVGLRTVPSLVLVLEPTAGDTTLVDNQILGVVSVYGEPQGDGLTSDQILRLKMDALKWSATSPNTKVQFFPAAGRLSIDRNEISRLTFGGGPQTQLRDMATPGATGRAVNGIYRAAFLGQNRFTLGGNRVVAKDVRLTDNIFEPAAPDLGAAIAETAIYVGNGSVLDDIHMFSNLSLNLRPHRPDDVNYMSIPI